MTETKNRPDRRIVFIDEIHTPYYRLEDCLMDYNSAVEHLMFCGFTRGEADCYLHYLPFEA